MRHGIEDTLHYVGRHTAGLTRMPLLLTGKPGTGRMYSIKQGIANSAKSEIIKERVLRGLTDDVIVIYGPDPIKDIREQLDSYYEREQPTELGHKHIVVRALDQASQSVNDMLLKITEEPPANTIITMTATSRRGVMPAIGSRTLSAEMPDHTPESMKALMMANAHLKTALPTLSRKFPPVGTNEARWRYRHNLDQLAENIVRANTTYSEIRGFVLKIHSDAKEDVNAILTILIRLVERHMMVVSSGKRGAMAGFSILHQTVEEVSTRYIERGRPEQATSVPNGAALTLCSYLTLGLLIKEQTQQSAT